MSKSKKDIFKVVDQFMPNQLEITPDGYIRTSRFETGIETLDALLDGGFPRGHIISLATEEGGGKTTLAIQAAGNIIEKYDKYVYYLDVERGATPELAFSMGYGEHYYHPKANPHGKFIRIETKVIQDIARILKLVANDPDTGLIVIDSTTATTDRRDLEDDELGLSNKAQAKHARMWSEAARQINAIIDESTATLLFIHQVRDNLSNFIVRTEAARGRALKHITSVEIFGTIGKWLDKNGDEQKGRDGAVGATLNLTTTKNRLTAPYAKVKVPLFFGKGISNKWAYKEWLEHIDIVNETTGEVVKALNIKGGGHATLTLPSGSYNVRGKEEITAIIDEHIEEIMNLIHTRGGLRLDNELPLNVLEDDSDDIEQIFKD